MPNLFSSSGNDSDKFKIPIWTMKREKKKYILRQKDILDIELPSWMTIEK